MARPITDIFIDVLRNRKNARYVHEWVPVSRADARRSRAENIKFMRARLHEAQRELAEAIAAPLQTERMSQIELLPGDPGYDEAPIAFNFAAYQGDSAWMNLVNEAP